MAFVAAGGFIKDPGGDLGRVNRLDLNHMDFSDQLFWNDDTAPEVWAGKMRTPGYDTRIGPALCRWLCARTVA